MRDFMLKMKGQTAVKKMLAALMALMMTLTGPRAGAERTREAVREAWRRGPFFRSGSGDAR